jgi:hypothetical protein
MSRRSGIRFADKDMRQHENLRRFPVILDHRVIQIQYDREASVERGASIGRLQTAASRSCDGGADVSQSGQKPVGLPPPPF